MRDPQRWLEQGGASLEVALLRAARADAAPAGAKERALEALGLGTDASAEAGPARAQGAARLRSVAGGVPFGSAPRGGLSRRPVKLSPAVRAVLFESVLGVGEPRGGLFGPNGAGLPVLLAVAAAAAFWLAVPSARPKPVRFGGIEVAEMAAPVPKTHEPSAKEGVSDVPVGAKGRLAHGSEGGALRDRLPLDRHAEHPANDQGQEVAPVALPAPADLRIASEAEPAPVAAGPPPSTLTVLPFGSGMTRPVLISGRDPVYTREALAARVEGTVLVKCTITPLGTLTHCRVQQSVPWMDQAVLDAMATRHYRPVTYQGRPISVDYVFTFRLVLPK